MVPLKARGAFTYARRDLKAGQSFEATERDAHILVTIGRAEGAETPSAAYQTRVMKPDLETMSIDELRALASSLGLKVHHRAGAEKIRAAIKAVS